jgi:cystathionine gamma-synthase
MSFRDLLEWPMWEGKELGLPLPESAHAVSVALPRWQDVVGYEEKRPEVISRLRGGYPRFVIHRFIKELAHFLDPVRPCLPFPSRLVAERCADFIYRSTGENAVIVARQGTVGVSTTEKGAVAMNAFWMHTGQIMSSRMAEARLSGTRDLPYAHEIRRSLRRQLAELYDCEEHDVFLKPTGMGAQFDALRILLQRSPGLPTVQLGFPYVDTLKIQQKFGHDNFLLHNLSRVGEDLLTLADNQPLAGCFCEIPGNPQLGSADLRVVSPTLRQRKVPLVVDDVVATPYNIDLSRYADMIATSLTKFLAGTGDVMGGALVFNPRSPMYVELKQIASTQHEELLWIEDAGILDQQVRMFPDRMRRHNANGLLIAERLRQHPAVERVWYPKWEFNEVYESVKRPGGGYSALIAFLPKNAVETAPRIFDNMRVCKGPSLGTVFTLACPFTVLAHFPELEWAEACGVPRHLIRISVGLENAEDLWKRIDSALNSVLPQSGEAVGVNT